MASSNDNDEFSCSAHEFGDDVLVAVAAWWCSAASYTIAYLSAVAIEANRNKVAHNHDNSEDDDDKSPVVTKRIWRPISTIFDELGTYYQRQAYQMDAESFYELHCILYPYLKPKEIRNASGSKPKQRNGAPNGLIPSTTRLAAALRFFAGASRMNLLYVMEFPSKKYTGVSTGSLTGFIDHPYLTSTFQPTMMTKKNWQRDSRTFLKLNLIVVLVQ